MNSFTYFQQVKDDNGSTATAVSGTGRKQTYNLAPEGQAPVASVRARGPETALMQGRWAGKLPEEPYSFDLKPAVSTRGPQHPSPTPTGGVDAMVPRIDRKAKEKAFL